MKIYIDHNILDDLSKERIILEAPEDTIWVYSDETFNEIKRAENNSTENNHDNHMRFLDVLRNLKARKLELELDDQFKLTGRAFLHNYYEPRELYQQWLDNVAQIPIEEHVQSQIEFLARLAGADNRNEILQHHSQLKNFLYTLLSPSGLITSELESEIEQVVEDIKAITHNQMQDIQNLEHSREAIGSSRGRVNNLSNKNNPLQLIWLLLSDENPGMTINQFYGFDPFDKQGYEKWPLYLGIVSCHMALNFIGFQPDKGLNNVEKIPSILSDGAHTAMATYCDAILSKDKKFCAKARAIYEYLNFDIKVFEATPKNNLLGK